MPIKHTLVSGIADDVVPAGKVQPSDWNANHDLSGVVPADLPAFAVKGRMAKDVSGVYRTFWPTAAPTQSGHTVNTWRAQLVVIPIEMTVIPAVNVSGAVASSKINAALYFADATTGLPVTKAYDLITADCSTTGLKTGSSVTIAPGEYWFVYNASGGSPTCTSSASGVGTAGPLFSRVQLTAGTSGTARQRLESLSTAITPLPSPLTPVTWTESAGSAITSPVYIQVQ